MLHIYKNIFFVYILLVYSSIYANPNHGNKRIIDDDLSEIPHHFGDEHNDDYDHEAFLGKEEAKRFDEMSPEESVYNLGKIFNKIDTNNDGVISTDEMTAWISNVSKNMLAADADHSWKEHNLGLDEKLSWKAYVEETFGKDDDYKDEDDQETKNKEIAKDELRWKTADADGDGKLSKEEYSVFLHPEIHPKMRDVIIRETLDDIDTNKNGFIELDEYIHDLWTPQPNEEEPEWVKTEREQFTTRRDKDGDGKLNLEEIGLWIVPENFDHVQNEVQHLFAGADSDQDGLLSKDEVLSHVDLFVGSQATNYGESLSKHDEL